ncbi:hypothetical protein S245_013372, partial [Arachis hypogaea]
MNPPKCLSFIDYITRRLKMFSVLQHMSISSSFSLIRFQSLVEINLHLTEAQNTGGVCFSLGKGMYRVLYIPEDEAVLLNSREKAPYMICVEVLRCDMIRDLSSHLNTLAESETEGVQGAAATGVFLFPEPEGLYLESERAVSREEGLALAKELGCLLLESSAKTRENVEQCFEELALKLALAAINSEVFLGSAQIYSLQKIKIY